jgi:hypothetical protein
MAWFHQLTVDIDSATRTTVVASSTAAVKTEAYCGVVKTSWPALIAFSLLFSVFFHYANRHHVSTWIEFAGGVIILLACNLAYSVLKKKSPANSQ